MITARLRRGPLGNLTDRRRGEKYSRIIIEYREGMGALQVALAAHVVLLATGWQLPVCFAAPCRAHCVGVQEACYDSWL